MQSTECLVTIFREKNSMLFVRNRGGIFIFPNMFLHSDTLWIRCWLFVIKRYGIPNQRNSLFFLLLTPAIIFGPII